MIMPMTSAVEALMVQQAIEERPRCEGLTHSRGAWGHDPSAPAALLAYCPDGGGHAWLVCSGWASRTLALASRWNEKPYYFKCPGGHTVFHKDVTFLPLPDMGGEN